jgi:hypothetical protein
MTMPDDIASKQAQVEGTALLVAEYYSALIRNNVPPETAAQLSSEWQATILKMVADANVRAEGRAVLARLFGRKP